MHHIECSGMNGAVRRLLWLSSAGYVPRKQFVDIVDLVVRDAAENVGEPITNAVEGAHDPAKKLRVVASSDPWAFYTPTWNAGAGAGTKIGYAHPDGYCTEIPDSVHHR